MYPWLAMLGFPAWELITDGVPGPVWAAVAGLVAAGVLYAITIRRAFAVPRRPAGRTFAALAALSTLLAAVYLGAWHTLFIMTAIAASVALRRAGPYAAAGLAAAAFAVEFARLPPGGAPAGAAAMAWGTFTAGLVPWIILRLFEAIAQLRRTREELALAAVERERLRFSRDLHDLLGHTLSVMVVKAELVRRVAPHDAAAAARQAADIERIGRQALAEVRAAVTGYRGRGLAAELDAARIALADAGITATIRTVPLDLPPETDALLGWAVREGTTNVLRHSGAATCRITLERADGEVLLLIEDDGHGPAHGDTAAPDAPLGNGLMGLRERVTAVEGRLAFGPRPSGGFRLLVRVPLPRATGEDPVADADENAVRPAPRHDDAVPVRLGDGDRSHDAALRATRDRPAPAAAVPVRGGGRAEGGRSAAGDGRGSG